MAAIDVSAAEVIEQLKSSFGNISHAAGKLNTSRKTLHAYINEHPTVASALADIRESTKDRAESMLQQRMATSDTLLIFYLKTQAHDRGYGDRSQLDVRTKDVSQLSDDELRAIVEGKSSSGA